MRGKVVVDNLTSLRTMTVAAAITADVTGDLTGDVTGDVTGNLTGDVTGDVTGNVTGNLAGGVQLPVTLAAGDGAIAVKMGIVLITKATAAALTLAAPTATTDDGKILVIDSATAAAHTVTVATGLRGAGAGADVGTFGGAIGDGISLYAYNGAWYPVPGTNLNVTFA